MALLLKLLQLLYVLMESLSKRWSSLEERFQEEKGAPKSLSSINRAWLDKLALHDLDQDGFAVPSWRDVAKTWAVGLEALPVSSDGPGRPAEMCTFVHFLNLVWQPVLSSFESLCKNETQENSARVDRNEKSSKHGDDWGPRQP